MHISRHFDFDMAMDIGSDIGSDIYRAIETYSGIYCYIPIHIASDL